MTSGIAPMKTARAKLCDQFNEDGEISRQTESGGSRFARSISRVPRGKSTTITTKIGLELVPVPQPGHRLAVRRRSDLPMSSGRAAGNFTGQQDYGTNTAFPQDGVHPHWAGHLVMAYAYLKALGWTVNRDFTLI